MKKTIITLLALAGVAAAETTPLTVLNDTYGTLIGSRANEATTASAAFNATTGYNTLANLLVNDNEWYVTNGYVIDLDGWATHADNAVTLAAGGPSANSASGAIKFTLSEETIAQYNGAITLSFDVALSGGNNNKNHTYTFSLLHSDWTISSIYNSKEGGNLLSTDATQVNLTITDEQVATMQAAGGDQTFVLLAATNAVTGSNRGVIMNNFQMSGEIVPEPTTATLSLLALAGLAARRRRK